jgi:hypothetical protein
LGPGVKLAAVVSSSRAVNSVVVMVWINGLGPWACQVMVCTL